MPAKGQKHTAEARATIKRGLANMDSFDWALRNLKISQTRRRNALLRKSWVDRTRQRVDRVLNALHTEPPRP